MGLGSERLHGCVSAWIQLIKAKEGGEGGATCRVDILCCFSYS